MLFTPPIVGVFLLVVGTLATPIPGDLIGNFFDNYDIVWPESANKLAYTFFAASQGITDNSMVLVVDGRLVLDPMTVPDEDTCRQLRLWLQTVPFDPSIRYYQILKDLESDSFEIPQAEITNMEATLRTDHHRHEEDPTPRTQVNKWKQHERGRCMFISCVANVQCFASGGGKCLCAQTPSGRFCRTI
ncbi:hypothetical protein JCM33374_g5913 [Metschnikowia sp. JCM 33374]|nr:hypothetical protein JCM33374_g5913 [Metschnikowia sp. JCM 33374]